MKSKCFKEPIFNGIVKGQITQFREIVVKNDLNTVIRHSVFVRSGYETIHGYEVKPRYKVGETVYLKEPCNNALDNYRILYKYDNDVQDAKSGFWKNAVTMSLDEARYFIEITGIRCERLQNISDEDCLRESIKFDDIFKKYKIYENNGFSSGIFYDEPQEAYAALINKIHGKGTWESNPYVFVYDFKLVNNNKNE